MSVQVVGKKFDQPRRPLLRLRRHRDLQLAEAFNALVGAVYELQVCVSELQEWVKAQPPANLGSPEREEAGQ